VSTGPLVVIGDALLDVDIRGTIKRVTPDGRAPVVDCDERRERPGGAGLAGLLAAAPGDRDVVLITGLGDDDAGERVAEMLYGAVNVVRLPLDGGTPQKTRVMTHDQTLVRLDTGSGRVTPGSPLPGHARLALTEAAAVLVADYGRGISAHPGVRDLLAELTGRVPVAWDPHPRGGHPVPGVRLVTPNESEARNFAVCAEVQMSGKPPAFGENCAFGEDFAFGEDSAFGKTRPFGENVAVSENGASGGSPAFGEIPAPQKNSASAEATVRGHVNAAGRHAAHLVRAWGVSGVAITLGGMGAVLAAGARPPVEIPAVRVSAPDTCGAGDSFAAAVARALADGLPLADTVALGVHAATSFVAAGAASGIR
jgi:D-beta-D-heptose 7-phosphate kinase / D-beta-D-heptose 1-phosphate adenosyltransferase